MANSWKQLADLLETTARMRLAEWKCGFPPFDCLPDETTDAAVSAWCWVMARAMEEPLDPPPEVKPWILARLAVASVEARMEEKEGTPVPELSIDLLRNMMVASWHQQLRERWNMMVWVDLDSWL